STEAGSAAASFQVTSGGLRVQAAASAYSPYPPSDGRMAATSSPTATSLTSLPIASTVPAVSKPSTAGVGKGKISLTSPRRIFRSVGPTPETRTLIRISVADGSGIGTSSQSRTSGGPYPVTTQALGMISPPIRQPLLGVYVTYHVMST